MLKMLQLNADKSKLVSGELRLLCEKESVDVACVQEPYTYRGRMQGMPAGARVVLPMDDHPMVAIIIFNKNIDILVHATNCDRWVQCVEISEGKTKFILVNIYC